MVGKVLYYLLSNDANFSGVTTSIFPERVPEGTDYPFCRYSQISTTPTDDKDGASTLDEIIVQVDYWHTSKDSLETLAGYGRSALDRQSGTIQGQNIDKIIFLQERSDYDEDAEAYRVMQEFRIRLKR